jgi:ribonucleoside-diphosphate reductase alpha chain
MGSEGAPRPSPAESVVSRGLVRGKMHERLKVVDNGGSVSLGTGGAKAASSGASMTQLFGAVALKADPSVGGRIEQAQAPAETARPKSDVVARIAEARMKGYEGEACTECGNFTMVRNGTCLKCETCGSTNGCS